MLGASTCRRGGSSLNSCASIRSLDFDGVYIRYVLNTLQQQEAHEGTTAHTVPVMLPVLLDLELWEAAYGCIGCHAHYCVSAA